MSVNLPLVSDVVPDLPRLRQCTRLMQRGEYAEALSRLESLPRDPAVVVAMGYCHLATRGAEVALRLLEAAEAAEPLWSAPILLAGIAAEEVETEAALRRYERLLELEPQCGWAYYGLARLAQDGSAEAEAAYLKAASLLPRHPWIRLELATLYEAANELSKALDAFQQFSRLRPDDFEGHYAQGRILKALNQHELALKAFRQAERCNADIADVHYAIGTILEHQCDLRLAAMAYSKAIALDHTFADAFLARGFLAYEVRHFQQCADDLERYLDLEQGEAVVEAHYYLASALRRLSRYSSAREHIRIFIERATGADGLKRYMGMAIRMERRILASMSPTSSLADRD